VSDMPWSIDWMKLTEPESICPSCLIVELHDSTMIPALDRFAENEALQVEPDENGRKNVFRLLYPRDDIEEARKRLDYHLTEFYWKKHHDSA
jgi:hypothetical protein